MLDGPLDPNVRSPDARDEPLLWRAVWYWKTETVKLLPDRGGRR